MEGGFPVFWLVLSTALAPLFSAEADALVIDTFDSGDPFVIENLGGPNPVIIQVADVLGGTREVETGNRVEFDPSIGLDLIATPIAGPSNLQLVYRPNGAHLAANGELYFQLTIEPISVFLSDSVFVQILADGQQFLSATVSGSGLFPFAEIPIPFDDPNELSNVQELIVNLRFSSDPTNRSIRVTDFRTVVPEPGTGLLLGFGLVGLAMRRQQRNQNRVAEGSVRSRRLLEEEAASLE